MLQYTSGSDTPWTVVESIDKRFARVRVLEEVCAALESALGSKVGEVPVAGPGAAALS